jgi:hypothetical protein
MPLPVVQRLGYAFLWPKPPAGPWPPAEIVALLTEFRDRGLAEASAPTDNLPQLFDRVLAVHVEHARLAEEALEHLRAGRRAALTAPSQCDPPSDCDGLQDTIAELAQRLGWRVHRDNGRTCGGMWPAAWGQAGFPRLAMARGPRHGRPGRMVLVALGVERKQLDPDQRLWHDTLAQVPGLEVYAWPLDALEDIAGTLA